MRLIDAESLVLEVDCLETCTCRKAHGWMVPVNEVCRTIVEAPTIYAVPVKHGEWKRFNSNWGECSVCGEKNKYLKRWNYCPNCGAKMDGERKDDE